MEIPTGKDIREIRLNQEITQSELAERAEVSQPLIARIETDSVDPTIDTLYNIVSALDNSGSELNHKEIKMSISSVLRNARSRMGYTQRELAKVSGVSQPLISRIEREDVNPRASTLRKIFRHVEPISDYDDNEYIPQSKIASEGKKSDTSKKIMQNFENAGKSSVKSKSATKRTKASKDSQQYSRVNSNSSILTNSDEIPDTPRADSPVLFQPEKKLSKEGRLRSYKIHGLTGDPFRLDLWDRHASDVELTFGYWYSLSAARGQREQRDGIEHVVISSTPECTLTVYGSQPPMSVR